MPKSSQFCDPARQELVGHLKLLIWGTRILLPQFCALLWFEKTHLLSCVISLSLWANRIFTKLCSHTNFQVSPVKYQYNFANYIFQAEYLPRIWRNNNILSVVFSWYYIILYTMLYNILYYCIILYSSLILFCVWFFLLQIHAFWKFIFYLSTMSIYISLHFK